MNLVKRGFTLVELLIVMAVIGVLAAGLIVGLDPIDKINQANDTKVKSDIAQMSSALLAYAAGHDGLFPCVAVANSVNCPNKVAADGAGLNALVNSGELTKLPVPPSGYAPVVYNTNYTADNTASPRAAGVFMQLKSKRYTAKPNWKWCAVDAKAGETATTACPFP